MTTTRGSSRGMGGLPARRAVGRWAWRLFRKEWRQQTLVLSLLVVALAFTVIGLGLAGNASAGLDARFGTADTLIVLPGTAENLDADVSKLTARFGTVEVTDHQSVPVPGSVTPLDVRAQDPEGAFASSTLRVDAGHLPTGPDEVAVTAGVMSDFGVAIGDSWNPEGHHWRVVGQVENPLDLLQDFALVSPGAAAPATSVSVLAKVGPGGDLQGLGVDGAQVTVRPTAVNAQATFVVFTLAAVGAIFVGLVAVAGFSVIAQRRLRGLGMLGALGASSRHLRFALLANGAFVGVVGAIVGAALGLVSWFLAVPSFEHIVNHRIERLDLSWGAILGAMILAVVTSVLGSWLPARTAARTPIVSALATRPAPPRSARMRTLPGVITMAAGLVVLAWAPSSMPIVAVLGVAGAVVGMLMVAPIGTSLLAAGAARAPVAVRLAVRDLVRYRSRSGGAVAAVTLAVAISVAISVSAGAAQVAANTAAGGGNLPDDELVLWLGNDGGIGPLPAISVEALDGMETAVADIAVKVGASSTLALEVPVSAQASGGIQVGGDPTAEGQVYEPVAFGLAHEVTENGKPGTMFFGNEAVPIFVATPAVLTRFGIDAGTMDADVDILTSRSALDGYELIPIRGADSSLNVQHADLPTHKSEPTTLMTAKLMDRLGLIAAPTAWLLEFDAPLTAQQRAEARTLAVQAGLHVETRPVSSDLDTLRLAVTAGGMALALAVLAMTVGLIRSETASDLVTLTATGASSRVRRTITAATAGSLALVGAVFGTTGAYLTLVVWHRHHLAVLSPAPLTPLLAMLVGLPLIAWAVGWLLGGREPRTLARRSLD